VSAPVRAPDLAELDTLVVCAVEGSLVATAARLGISRPAVAKRIKNLEALVGRPLLHREARGVRLTEEGATLLGAARRILEERDVLLSTVTEIRGEGPSSIAGLRELLGYSPQASRAAQQPEARLGETERVLEFILRTSATGVIISNPDTAVIYEVNDAFCRFTGRSHAELLSESAIGVWQDPGDRDGMIAEVRRTGIAENITSRVKWPDGTVRLGEAAARFIPLTGTRRLLATVNDVTEQHRLDDERAAGVTAYRAVTQLAVLLLGGHPVLKSIGSVLPELRRSGGFQTALLWNLKLGRPAAADGDKPPRELSGELLRGQPLPGGVVVRLGPAARGAATGWAVPLTSIGHSVILLGPASHSPSTQTLFTRILADLAALASAGG
jgi:PAS domain S-box-containing protein